MPSKAKKTKESVSFDDYKAIKDEIIEISEQRFENILTKRLKEFKNSLMDELNVRFDAIDSRFNSIDSKFDSMDSKFSSMDSKFSSMDSKFSSMDSKFDSLEKRLTFITWFLPVFITILMLVMKYLK